MIKSFDEFQYFTGVTSLGQHALVIIRNDLHHIPDSVPTWYHCLHCKLSPPSPIPDSVTSIKVILLQHLLCSHLHHPSLTVSPPFRHTASTALTHLHTSLTASGRSRCCSYTPLSPPSPSLRHHPPAILLQLPLSPPFIALEVLPLMLNLILPLWHIFHYLQAETPMNQGVNMLYVPQGATGYDAGYWLDPLQNATKCGFTISYTL